MPKAKQYNTRSLYFPSRIRNAMEGILKHPLTIIEAPMGYGKTTATREFLSKAGVNVLWQRVYDSGEDSFWECFCRLFSDLDSDRAQGLLQLGVPKNRMLMQEATKLIRGINLTEPTVLVIDDYHLASTPYTNSFIESLVEDRINYLHIVLIMRFVKLEKLEELVLKGFLHHITMNTFELMPEEIREYYRICGISINDGEAQRLYMDSEGWISALYLFMLEYAEKGSYTPVGSIYKLIEKAIYVSLPGEMQEFLVTMCIFSSFTLKQALYMWEKENARRFLEEFTGNNSFVTYDNRHKTYHIHSIFAGFLKEVLDGKGEVFKQKLYRKAAHWFMESGNCLTSRDYFYKCKDFDGILLALEKDRSNDFSVANKELLKKYMKECPEDVKARHHYALLIYAMHLFVHKELELFEDTHKTLSANIEKDESLGQERRSRLLGELELLLSFAEFNDLKKMSARHRKAWEYLNQSTSIYAGTSWNFGSPSVLSLYYRESGRLAEHIKDMKETMSCYSRLTKGHGSGAEYVMEAESLFNQGDFDNAEIFVQKATLKAQEGMDESIMLSAHYFRILISFMKGELSKTKELIDKLHAKSPCAKQHEFIHTVEICEGLIYAYLDQDDRIPARLLKTDMDNPQLGFPALPFFNVMYGRLLLIRGEYLKLIGSAEHFISVSSVFSSLLGYIYTYIYLAAAYRKIFRDVDALASLKKALEIAIPDKQYMLFAENSDYMEPILEAILSEGLYKEDILKILELSKIFKRSKAEMNLRYFTGIKPKLTRRETEIARLAAAGKTNAEIGNQLFISVNTVKKALESIYEKLSINSRALLKQHFDDLDIQ